MSDLYLQANGLGQTLNELIDQYFGTLGDLPPILKLVAMIAFVVLAGFIAWIIYQGKNNPETSRLEPKQRFTLLLVLAFMLFTIFVGLLAMYEIPLLQSSEADSSVTCDEPVAYEFHPIWSRASTRQDLGCPREREEALLWSYQPMESGHLLWQRETRRIYGLGGDRTWFELSDSWTEDLPEYSCVPTGFSEGDDRLPRLGFGKVWCEDSRVRAFGGALQAEAAYTLTHQLFDAGVMLDMRPANSNLGVLVMTTDDSRWQRHQ